MKTEEVMTILEENKITNVGTATPYTTPQCKGQNCDEVSTIEDPKGNFYCDECYTLFSYTRTEYGPNPNAKGYTDRK